MHLQTCALLRVTLGVIITVSQSKDSIVFCKLELNVIDKKITLKIWFNLGLNSTIFRGTGHRRLSAQLGLVSRVHTKKLQPFFKDFSRTKLDFRGQPTRNIISQIVQKCIFTVYSNKTLRL